MAANLGYDGAVRPLLFSIASVALLVAVFAQPRAQAQIGSVAPSVTSLGFGGSNHVGAVVPSVTSRGFGSGFGRTGPTGFGGHHSGFFGPARPNHSHESLHHRPFRPLWGSYYAYPIFEDWGNAYPDDAVENPPDDDEYQGGPTIFDRRGDGQYSPPGATSHSAPAREDFQSNAPPQEASEVAEQPQTILVFKDGHQAEIDNYAIVGNTLFDLSGGKRHKIALTDLDLSSTAKQNDDRGVDFQLPAGPNLN